MLRFRGRNFLRSSNDGYQRPPNRLLHSLSRTGLLVDIPPHPSTNAHLYAGSPPTLELRNVDLIATCDQCLGENHSAFLRKVVFEWDIDEALNIRWTFHVLLRLQQNCHVLPTQPREKHTQFQHDILACTIGHFVIVPYSMPSVIRRRKHNPEIGVGNSAFEFLDYGLSLGRQLIQD